MFSAPAAPEPKATANKEKIASKKAQDYQNNKEKIAARRSEKITCICGSIIRYGYKARHERSKKHQDLIKSKMDKQTNQIIQSEIND